MIRMILRLALLAVLAGPAFAAGEFKYQVPQGWRDLSPVDYVRPPQDDSQIPMDLIREAVSGRYKLFAVDPRNTTWKRAGSTMNVVEVNTAGRITLALVQSTADQIAQQFNAAGATVAVRDVQLTKIDGVEAGMTLFDVGMGEETRTLLQFAIPGKQASAFVTYAAPRDDFASYRAVFEASVNATQGAYNHGFDWKRSALRGGLIGLACGAVWLLVVTLVRRRRDGQAATQDAAEAQASPATPPVPRPAQTAGASSLKNSKHVWICAACGKPVPARLEQCRCGAAKPA